jgi:hypothetical protein
MPGTRQKDRALLEPYGRINDRLMNEGVRKFIEEMQAQKAALHPQREK